MGIRPYTAKKKKKHTCHIDANVFLNVFFQRGSADKKLCSKLCLLQAHTMQTKLDTHARLQHQWGRSLNITAIGT